MPLLKGASTSKPQVQTSRSTSQRLMPNEICPYCQEVLVPTRLSAGEIIINTLCLLLAFFIVVWPPVEHWIGQQEHRWVEHMT